MAGDWIKFETSTPDKPEVWEIAQMLGIDPDAVVGKLMRVWGWFDQHTEEGNASAVTKMLLDRIVGVNGFCEAVISAGWMTEDDGVISIANFERHNGQTAKNRALTAKRVAKHKSKTNEEGNAPSVNVALPKEEKRREDILGAKEPAPRTEYQKIVDLYNEILPELRSVRDVTPDRKKHIQARINDDAKRQDLEWWKTYFNVVRGCDLPMGLVSAKVPGNKPWQADFDWLINPNNMAKVIEGKYE